MKKLLKNRLEKLFKPGKKYYQDKLQEKFPDISPIVRKKTPVVIYGAGKMGRVFKANLAKKGIKTLAFVDGNADLWGKRIGGVKIIPPRELKKNYSHKPVLVASLVYETEIYEKLRRMKLPLVFPLCFLNYQAPNIFVSPEYFQKFNSLFSSKNQAKILKLAELWSDEESRRVFYQIIKFRLTFNKSLLKSIKSKREQYFDPKILSLGSKEVFLDCGAFTGDSLERFYKKVSGKFNKIYSFEPDQDNFSSLRKTIQKINSSQIVPIKKGVYQTTSKVGFRETSDVDARIDDQKKGTTFISVVALDDFLKNKEEATFIKMDIEGAEKEALLGAKRTLQKSRPKLAISAYHQSVDLWEIPRLIKRCNKNYRLFLRHYTDEIIDTVCYAI